MKPYTESEPVFSESIQVTEPTDPAHADNINAGPKQLLQNTLVNKKEIEDLKQGNNEVEFDDTVIPGEGEGPGEVPDPAEALEQITSGKSVPALIGHIKRTLTGLLPLSQRALNIAMGKNQARVFATVDALDAWLSVPEHTAELKVGDNFYIMATDVPDYWWDGSAKQELEVQKVNLTTYDRKIAALEAKDSELNENISSHNHDGRYYTEAEINNLLAGKAGTSHSHDWSSITGKPSVYAPADHNHDNQYYNKTETARLHSWKPVGSFTGNSALKIPSLTGLHEFMVGWRYNDDIPWLYIIFPSDGSRALGSYYYSEKYFGCAGFLIENGSVFKLNQSWCTAKSGSVTYSADNIQVYVYCR